MDGQWWICLPNIRLQSEYSSWNWISFYAKTTWINRTNKKKIGLYRIWSTPTKNQTTLLYRKLSDTWVLPLMQRVIVRPRRSETCCSRWPALHRHKLLRHSPKSPQSAWEEHRLLTARAKKIKSTSLVVFRFQKRPYHKWYPHHCDNNQVDKHICFHPDSI